MKHVNYIDDYTENYLAKIFYYSLKKTGNENDADELASDIGYQVLLSLSRNNEIEDFSRWVWRIAANTYKKWAKKRYYSPGSNVEDVDGYTDSLAAEGNLEEELVLAEDMASLRRELAFIRSDYRKILIAHYFEEKSVSAIAREFSLPVGTVKTKLQKSRKELKEGMDMAREFGKRSYSPDEVWFTKHGGDAKEGQLFSILNHLMYKNIFLETYGEPKTAEELSLELGIALPYMENELEFFTDQTLLVKKDGRYSDNFAIISADVQKKVNEICVSREKELTKLLEDYVDCLIEKYGDEVYGGYVSREVAKWTLLMYVFDIFSKRGYELCKFRDRPDGGRWEIVGFENVEIQRASFVGFHTTGNFMKKITLGMFKYSYKDLRFKNPEIIHSEACAMERYLTGGFEDEDTALLDKIVEYGFMKKNGGEYTPYLVVIRDESKLRPESCEELAELGEKIRELFNYIFDETRRLIIDDLPEEIKSIPEAYSTAIEVGTIGRVNVFDTAMEDGWLRYDEENAKTYGGFVILK